MRNRITRSAHRQALSIEYESQEQRKARQERERIQPSLALSKVNAQIAAFESHSVTELVKSVQNNAIAIKSQNTI